MATVPNRTSADVNASADINTLQSQIVDIVSQAAAEAGVATDVKAWTAERVAQAIAALAAGGSTEMNPMYAAGSFDYPAANPAPLDTDDSFTNGSVKRQLFDDSTNESVEGQFKVPSDISATGSDTVTFNLYGYATVAAAGNVVFVVRSSHAAHDADIDAAWVSSSSGTKAVINTQDDLVVISWTDTITNLGWVASDLCRFIFLRDPDGTYTGTDSMAGDFGVMLLEIDIPRA